MTCSDDQSHLGVVFVQGLDIFLIHKTMSSSCLALDIFELSLNVINLLFHEQHRDSLCDKR